MNLPNLEEGFMVQGAVLAYHTLLDLSAPPPAPFLFLAFLSQWHTDLFPSTVSSLYLLFVT